MALSIIAVLSVLAFMVLRTALQTSQSTAYIVNISGKQRMLSQHLALDMSRAHNYSMQNTQMPVYTKILIQEAIKSHATQMLQNSHILTTGHLPDGTIISLSKEISDMYFGKTNLAARVEQYATIALQTLDNFNYKDIDKVKQTIDSYSEPLLVDLNQVVQQYQLEGEDNLHDIEDLEQLVLLFTIITLLLEVIFIFQPMVRQVVSLSQTNNTILQNLENTIELRTIHLEKANDKLKHLASHDPLTGLRNRFELEMHIEKAIHDFKKHSAPYAVLMFDIDWFKSVNDLYGHDTGDLVLIEFSTILSNLVREGDKVYRSGGEEFVILLNRINYDDSLKLAQKIRTSVERYIFKVNNKAFSKTVSCGLFHASLVVTSNVKEVLKLIDTALYASKTNGRNRVTIADKDMNTKVIQKIAPKIQIIFENSTFNKILKIDMKEDTLKCFANFKKENHREEFLDYVHPQDIELLKNIPTNTTKESPFTTTLRIQNIEGKIIILRADIFEDTKQHIIMTLQNSTDIAEQVSDALLIKNLHAMLDNTNDYIYFKDKNHVLSAASNTLVSVTSVQNRSEFVGKTDYDIFDKELADEYFKLERQILNHEVSVAQQIQLTIDNNGKRAWVDNRKYPIYDESGTIIGLFGIAREISELDYQKLNI